MIIILRYKSIDATDDLWEINLSYWMNINLFKQNEHDIWVFIVNIKNTSI